MFDLWKVGVNFELVSGGRGNIIYSSCHVTSR